MNKARKIFKNLLCLSTILMISACGSKVEPTPTPDPDKSNPDPDPDKPNPDKPNDLKEPPKYNEDSFSIHYARDDRKFSDWALWLWPDGGEGKEYAFNGVDEFGAVAAYPLSSFSLTSAGKLGFIVKSAGSWNSKDPDGDRFIEFSNLEKDSNNIYHVYLKSNDSNIYLTPDLKLKDDIKTAKFLSANEVTLVTSNSISNYAIYEDKKEIYKKDLSKPLTVVQIKLGNIAAKIEKEYEISVTFSESKATLTKTISKRALYKTDAFNKQYNYDGELGAIYSKNETVFKVWSPISSIISLRIYDNGTPLSVDKEKGNDNFKEYTMEKDDKGVFSKVVSGDLSNKYYTYVVTNSSYKEQEIVDPYAKGCGINGLRGAIIDFSKTNPDNWNKLTPLNIDRKAMTVYETHVADVTSSATWNGDYENKKKYTGLYESGTTYTSDGKTIKTGFDHIKELGVNSVQLLPIFDQANDETLDKFNWGYNPLNYNCLEGIYSKNPYDAYERIKEFKNLVLNYNKANINIIMDVVYNHVNGALGSNFDVLMPGYYFRYKADESLANASGCGNETASDMYMYRKFMVDSIAFWTKEYKLGGFRFDLMGIHDIDTMNALTKKAKEINPNIVIYGEPWDMSAQLKTFETATQRNASKFEGFGQFNDQMRDSLIKGGLNSVSSLGWVDNTIGKTSDIDLTRIQKGLLGSTVNPGVFEINDPDKTTNYVTCHDNYTLYDRFMATEQISEADAKKMNALANSLVFTSQGTSFMLAGEEFLRTKQGDNNSYESSYEVNELDYSLKVKNYDLFSSYQKLIKLKQTVDGLHLDKDNVNKVNININNDGNMISYDIKDSLNNLTYKIIHTNGYNVSSLKTLNLEGYKLYLDTINPTKTINNATKLEAFETLIVYK